MLCEAAVYSTLFTLAFTVRIVYPPAATVWLAALLKSVVIVKYWLLVFVVAEIFNKVAFDQLSKSMVDPYDSSKKEFTRQSTNSILNMMKPINYWK